MNVRPGLQGGREFGDLTEARDYVELGQGTSRALLPVAVVPASSSCCAVERAFSPQSEGPNVISVRRTSSFCVKFYGKGAKIEALTVKFGTDASA